MYIPKVLENYAYVALELEVTLDADYVLFVLWIALKQALKNTDFL